MYDLAKSYEFCYNFHHSKIRSEPGWGTSRWNQSSFNRSMPLNYLRRSIIVNASDFWRTEGRGPYWNTELIFTIGEHFLQWWYRNCKTKTEVYEFVIWDRLTIDCKKMGWDSPEGELDLQPPKSPQSTANPHWFIQVCNTQTFLSTLYQFSIIKSSSWLHFSYLNIVFN